MCRIIWQCTLTPPQPSTAAMAGRLNIPAADAHPPVTSSVQLSNSPAQSGRRSRGIYPETQEKMTAVVQSEIIDPVSEAASAPVKPKKAAAVDDDSDADKDAAETAAPAKKETFAERRARLAAEKAAAATQSVLKGTISYLGGH